MEAEEGPLHVKDIVMGSEIGAERGEQRRGIDMNEFFAMKGLRRG